MNSHLLYSLYNFRYFYNFFNQNFDRYLLSYVPHNCLWYLYHLLYFNDFLDYFLYLDNLADFISFRNYFLDDFINSYYSLLNNRNFNSSFNNFFYLAAEWHNLFHNSLYFLNPILIYYFLFNTLHFFYNRNFSSDFYNFFDDFSNLFDFLDSLNNRDKPLYYFLHDLRYILDVIDCLSSRSVLDSINYFFHNLFNLENDWFLNYLLNDFFNTFLNFFDLLNDFLHNHSLLSDNFYLPNFWHCVIDYFLAYYRLVDFNYFLPDDLNYHNFGNLDSSLYDLFNYLWYFNYSFSDLLDFHYLFYDSIHILYHLNWNVYDLLNLFYLSVGHKFLDNFLNWNNYWNLYHSLHNLLNYFLHLHYFVVDLEAF